jgi:hypothetical protein
MAEPSVVSREPTVQHRFLVADLACTRNDGSSVVFRTWLIAVNPDSSWSAGCMAAFEQETAIGNDIVRAMASAAGDGAVGWLIGFKAVRRFGIGIARPAPIPLGRHLRARLCAARKDIANWELRPE